MKKKQFATPEDRLIAVVAAARLKADIGTHDGLDQVEIAKRLNVNEVTVSRLLTEARRERYLSLEFHGERVPKDIRDEVQRLYFGGETTLKDIAPQGVNVIELPGKTEEEFCGAAAIFLGREIPRRSRRVGLMFGRAIHHISKAMTHVQADRSPLHVSPWCSAA
jgi:DNA-binding transcriptional regulator LsrR (DeoR family)